MTRELHADVVSHIALSHLFPLVHLAELDFASGFVRLTNAPFDLTYNSNTYSGIGDLGEVTLMEENSGLEAYSLNLKLSGIPSDRS